VQRVDGTCGTSGMIQEQWIFAYDGDGTRFNQIYTVGAAVNTTRYFPSIVLRACFGGAYEITKTNGVVVETKKYYSFAGQTLAMDDGRKGIRLWHSIR